MFRLLGWLRRVAARANQGPFDWKVYWEDRAKRYGVRAVYNLSHREEELAEVTTRQKQHLFPLLKQELAGSGLRGLDFGCGPGRFSPELAATLGGHVWAIDPIQSFIDKAPADEQVTYQTFDGLTIPFETGFFDVAWVCLVLGGLDDRRLDHTSTELMRVLKPGGLLFLVENTTPGRAHVRHWHFRAPADYQVLFPRTTLREIGSYLDLVERISIMAGRKEHSR